MAAQPIPGTDARLLELMLDAAISRADKLQAATELLEPLSLEQRLPLFLHQASNRARAGSP